MGSHATTVSHPIYPSSIIASYGLLPCEERGDGGGGHGVASAGIRFFSSTIEIVPSAHLTWTPPGRQMKSIRTFSQAAKVTPWMW